jgi:hypothetical protein
MSNEIKIYRFYCFSFLFVCLLYSMISFDVTLSVFLAYSAYLNILIFKSVLKDFIKFCKVFNLIKKLIS